MNWITKLVNKVSSGQNPSKDIPENLWISCPGCNTLLFKKDLQNNQYICSNCDYYFTFPVKARLASLFDNEQYTLVHVPKVIKDPIKFKDKEKYSDKLEKYQKKTGFEDGALAAYGKIGNNSAAVFIMNFGFIGGSMGAYVGEAFVAAAETALKHKIPLIAITASGGARMQEGMFSLMQMAKTTVMVEKLKNMKLPYLVVLTDPTTGGVTASFAMLGDIHIAEKGATIGFAGRRVIEQTIRKKLPEGFQTAEYLKSHGMVDIVVNRPSLVNTISSLLSLLANKTVS